MSGHPRGSRAEVAAQRLKQAVPGQLGLLTRRMGEASVNIGGSTATTTINRSSCWTTQIAPGKVSKAWAKES